MPLSDVLSTSISGLNANIRRVQVAANNIANSSTHDYQAQRVISVSTVSPANVAAGSAVQTHIISENNPVNPINLVRELTRLIEAETAYNAGLNVIHMAEQLSDATMDIVV